MCIRVCPSVSMIRLLMLVVAVAVSSASECDDLELAFMGLRDFYRFVAMPRKFDSYAEEASVLGIDLNDDAKIRELTCALADASSMDDIIASLDPEPGYAVWVQRVFASFLYTLEMEVEIFPDIKEEYDAAFEFLINTNFPSFPLGLSEERAIAAVNSAGPEALDRVLNHYIHGSEELTALAKAIAKAKSIDHFNYLTYGRYTDVTSNFAVRLQDMEARYSDAILRPKVQGKVLHVLQKYGIVDMLKDQTQVEYEYYNTT